MLGLFLVNNTVNKPYVLHTSTPTWASFPSLLPSHWNPERWYWWTYLQGRNGGANIENGLVHTGEWNERVALIYIHYLVWNSQLVGSCCKAQGAQLGSLPSVLKDTFDRHKNSILWYFIPPFWIFTAFQPPLFWTGQLLVFSSVQFSSVPQSCLTLCDPMDCSTPGLPVHHQLLDSTQTHVVELARR